MCNLHRSSIYILAAALWIVTLKGMDLLPITGRDVHQCNSVKFLSTRQFSQNTRLGVRYPWKPLLNRAVQWSLTHVYCLKRRRHHVAGVVRSIKNHHYLKLQASWKGLLVTHLMLSNIYLSYVAFWIAINIHAIGHFWVLPFRLYFVF